MINNECKLLSRGYGLTYHVLLCNKINDNNINNNKFVHRNHFSEVLVLTVNTDDLSVQNVVNYQWNSSAVCCQFYLILLLLSPFIGECIVMIIIMELCLFLSTYVGKITGTLEVHKIQWQIKEKLEQELKKFFLVTIHNFLPSLVCIMRFC